MKRNRILYAVLFLSSLIFVYFYGGKMPYLMFHTMLLLPLVSIIFTAIVYIRFKILQDIDKKYATKGDNLNFLIKVCNEDFFLYPYVRILFFDTEVALGANFSSPVMSLPPFSQSSMSFELDCRHRGSYKVGARAIEIEDFLGIFKITYLIREPKNITVYPRIIQLNRFRIPANYLSDSHTLFKNHIEDYTAVSDMRKYAPGDSFKKIHWKLTARKNQLMVKNYESTAETSTIIFLDLLKNNYSMEQNAILEDMVIECAIAVMNYCLQHSLPIELVYFEKELSRISAQNTLDFPDIYHFCSNAAFNGVVPVGDLIHVHIAEQSFHTNILVITHNLDYRLFDELCRARETGYGVILVYIKSDSLPASEEAGNILLSLPEINIIHYIVDINDDIKMILER